MTTTIELKTAPELKRLILAAFPGYKKHRAFVCVFGERGHGINSYWSGGSRDEFAIVEIATLRRQSLPTASHPYFDVARNGIANIETDMVSVDHVGNVTLKVLPEGFALISAGTFCGKAATACVYLPASNMPKYLTA